MLTTVFFFVLHALTWVLAVLLSLGAFLRSIIATFLIWFFYDSISAGVLYYTTYQIPEFSFSHCFWLLYGICVVMSFGRSVLSVSDKTHNRG